MGNLSHLVGNYQRVIRNGALSENLVKTGHFLGLCKKQKIPDVSGISFVREAGLEPARP